MPLSFELILFEWISPLGYSHQANFPWFNTITENAFSCLIQTITVKNLTLIMASLLPRIISFRLIFLDQRQAWTNVLRKAIIGNDQSMRAVLGRLCPWRLQSSYVPSLLVRNQNRRRGHVLMTSGTLPAQYDPGPSRKIAYMRKSLWPPRAGVLKFGSVIGMCRWACCIWVDPSFNFPKKIFDPLGPIKFWQNVEQKQSWANLR